jgi:hypothetical protein
LKPVTYHLEARAEANSAAVYYFARNPATASKFLDELEFIIEEIKHGPQRWPFESGTQIAAAFQALSFHSLLPRRSARGLHTCCRPHQPAAGLLEIAHGG